MDGHGLDPLKQQVLMDGIHICFLLCKDEHLSRKATSSQGVPPPNDPTFPSILPLLPSPLILGVLGCTHGRGCLLQALEQIHHLGLLLHIFHLLPPQELGQVILRTGLPATALLQRLGPPVPSR